ncbi:MAG: phosphodiesterase [Silicimonas sp.]|nr:phosphodiesterase [Silicimonas sp.]NNL72627.1 phosphodiesterase [Silicimonas sp.]
MSLPERLLTRPIAHRGLHDVTDGRPENSRAAVRAAIARDYSIEIDLQPSADGVAMVFHDYDLDRLSTGTGPIRDRSAKALGQTGLKGGDEGVPMLAEVLDEVRGRVPLLIELKDPDRTLGRDVGLLVRAAASVLEGYGGEYAVMSFNPHSVAMLAELLPEVPRGLVTEDFHAEPEWRASEDVLSRLTRIEDFDRVGARFVSHNRRQLDMPRIAELKAADAPVFCWTIRSPEQETEARKVADNVTFEGYLP